MAEEIKYVNIDARFGQKIDSWENWDKSSLILNKGELGIVEIPAQQTATGLTPPAIAIKVGNGKDLFKDLPWTQSAAGDVYAWAKKENLDYADLTDAFKEQLKGLVNTELPDTNTTYQFSFSDNVLTITSKEKGIDRIDKVAEIELDLTTKIDKVTGAAGKLAQFKEDGNIESTNVAIADLETKTNAANTYATITNLDNVSSDVTTIKGKVNTLIGSDADKSVRNIANEELAKQLLGETNAEDNFKTLQDLAAWLEDHPESAAEMNQKITKLEGDVSNLDIDNVTNKTNISDLQSTVAGHTSKIGGLETTVGNADAGLVKRVTDLETSLGVGDSTGGESISAQVAANAQAIEDIKEQIGSDDSGLIKEINTNKTNISDLQSTVAGHTSKIGGLETTVGTHGTDIETLKITVGDSNSGLVKGVADNTTEITKLKTTVGDSNSGLLAQVASIESKATTAVQTISGVTTTKSGTNVEVTAIPVSLLSTEGVTLVFNGGTATTVL